MCTLLLYDIKEAFVFLRGFQCGLRNLLIILYIIFVFTQNRLGGSVSYPENRPTRVTRSKVEGKEEATNEKSNEDEDPKEKTEEEKQNEMKEETSKVNSPDAAPAGPSSRLMRKKEERKKFIMKRVVKVRKGEQNFSFALVQTRC